MNNTPRIVLFASLLVVAMAAGAATVSLHEGTETEQMQSSVLREDSKSRPLWVEAKK